MLGLGLYVSMYDPPWYDFPSLICLWNLSRSISVGLPFAPRQSCKLEAETDIALNINGEFIYNALSMFVKVKSLSPWSQYDSDTLNPIALVENSLWEITIRPSRLAKASLMVSNIRELKS